MKEKEIRLPHDETMSHHRKADPAAQKALLNRMSRAIGHMESVKRMMENGKDDSEILIQLAAIRSAISGISRIILQEHIEETIGEALEHPQDTENLEDLNRVISYFIK